MKHATVWAPTMNSPLRSVLKGYGRRKGEYVPENPTARRVRAGRHTNGA